MENMTTKTRGSLRWRILRWGLIALAGLVTLIALLWAEENWRGKRAWENYKKKWEAKGEKFDLNAFVPPPVPDEENFAMTPFLAPVFDFKPNRQPGESAWRDTNAHQKVLDFGNDLGWPKSGGGWVTGNRMDLTAWVTALDGKKDVLASGETPSGRAVSGEMAVEKMKKYGPVLNELETASHRPYCRFNISYTDEDPAGILLPHLAMLKKFGLLYRLRAAADLAAGRSDAALEDVKMGFYLSNATRNEPVLISGLVQLAIVNITLQPVWEGLAGRRWSDAQLKELEQQLASIDLLKDYGATMRGERAFNNAIMDYQRRARRMDSLAGDGENGTSSGSGALNLMPSGWYYQNQLTVNRVHQEILFPPVDAPAHRVSLELSTNREASFATLTTNQFIMYKIFAIGLFPALVKAQEKYTVAAAYVDEAMTACALERYRLAHGQFPETLSALSPQFIEKVPADLVTGEPLKYRRTEDGQFILYSVGWNGIDDGGKLMMGQGSTPRVDITQGDWVWKYPGK